MGKQRGQERTDACGIPGFQTKFGQPPAPYAGKYEGRIPPLGATAAALNGPEGVAVDSAGNLDIADYVNNRVRKVATDGIITTVAGTGTPGYSGDGGPATSASLDYPEWIAVDASANLYILDSSKRIREVNSSGYISTIAGTGTFGFSGDGGSALAAEICPSGGIAVDASGNIYFVDNLAYVRKITSDWKDFNDCR